MTGKKTRVKIVTLSDRFEESLFDDQSMEVRQSQVKRRLIELMKIDERAMFESSFVEAIEIQTELTGVFLRDVIETVFVEDHPVKVREIQIHRCIRRQKNRT